MPGKQRSSGKGQIQREGADINVEGKSRDISKWNHENQVRRLIQRRGSDQLCPCSQVIEYLEGREFITVFDKVKVIGEQFG